MTRERVASAILSPDADIDFAEVLRWSVDRFGFAAAERYEELLIQAIRDVAADPPRPGSKVWPFWRAPGARAYHLLFSRDRVAGKRVIRPRHFLVYRTRQGSTIEIARILHDSRDLPRQVPAE